jgi:stearoyl-CoA desaturase (delta-9 desaturase)
MMKPVARMQGEGASALSGRVVWSPAKSLWNMSMLACAIVFAPWLVTPAALLLFGVTTYCSLLLGHSVGMHRRFIHRSYACAKWLERSLVYVGVLVGVAGPFGILRVHDERDWAQRQNACHDFFAHRRSPLVDLFWQLNCRFRFARAPVFAIEPEFAGDRWYRFLERTWMLQQVPIALACFAIGGWSWVVWGVPVRVCVSVIGLATLSAACATTSGVSSAGVSWGSTFSAMLVLHTTGDRDEGRRRCADRQEARSRGFGTGSAPVVPR